MAEMMHTREALHKHNNIKTWLGVFLLPAMFLLMEFEPIAALETALSPVVKDGEFLDIQEVNDLGIIVSGSAFKRRECGWEETLFYIGTRDGPHSRLRSARHLSPPIARPRGELYWEQMFLPVLAEQFLTGNFFADVVHTCSGRDVTSRLFTRVKGVDQ